ncbi:MAG: AbrB/MazE/SpoVT family DNA-binding domain-containing protein [Acidobacteriota bacterium]|nr:AbrB/MazE/SpoVT family DNA-binding domain-containing protein [Acidobacteriota bacterium]
MNEITLSPKPVTLSPKYQVVIPLEIRTALRLKPGQKIQAIRVGETISLIPVKPMEEYRGFLKGIDTTVEREPDREL